MSHAMAEFAQGRFIDFNSNCSAVRLGGHFPYGWVEYRISEDIKKWSDIGIHMISTGSDFSVLADGMKEIFENMKKAR